MRVICHIGHHKTGTTSLQAFMAQNSYELLKKGIYYPWVESRGAAHMLKKTLDRKDKKAILEWNIREAHNALAFKMMSEVDKAWNVPKFHPEIPHSNQMLIALHNQISALQPETTVIVSEVLSSLGKLRPNLIHKLRHGLRAAEQFHLWATIRRPDEYAVSWYGQEIRMGNAPSSLSNLETGVNYKGNRFNYVDVIKPWISQIQGCVFTLRPYSEVMKNGGSIEDFFTALPAKQGDFIPVEKMNESIAPGALAVMRDINAKIGKEQSGPIRQRIIDLSHKMSLPSSKEVELLGQEQRRVMFERFKPIHKWLSDTSGRDAFFTDVEEMLVCKPVTEQEAKDQFLDILTADDIKQIENEKARQILIDLKQRNRTK